MYTVSGNTQEIHDVLYQLGNEAEDENYHEMAAFYFNAAKGILSLDPPFRVLFPADYEGAELAIATVTE